MTKISLFYADWCGHCRTFKPIWDALKKEFVKNNVEYKEYEDSKNEEIIKKEGIDGFPTIKIENDNGVKYEYMGERSADGILNEVLPNLQIGGNLKKYFIKYSDIY